MNINDLESLPVGWVIKTGVFELKKVNPSYWRMSTSASFTSGDTETVLRLLEGSGFATLSFLEKGSKMPPPGRTSTHE